MLSANFELKSTAAASHGFFAIAQHFVELDSCQGSKEQRSKLIICVITFGVTLPI